MVSWPDLGTRVTLRYRRPAGSVPPLTDAVGHLLAVDPVVRVRTKTGAVVEVAPAAVVALRVLTDAPVRTAQIRALEHAAAAGWPGVEQTWLDGWLLRAGHGATFGANSAVPLDISADASAIPAIVTWYTRRDITPRLAIPDRLLPLPAGVTSERADRVLVRDVRDVSGREPDQSVTLSARPDDAWLRLYHREVPFDVLTAVVDGELMFGTYPGLAVARAAVTNAPDGTRGVGLSAMRAADDQAGPASRVCEALLAWGARRGASRSYVRVGDDDTSAITLAESLGFRLHHRCRYFPAPSGRWDTV
ncbi:MAG TPA: GNAT family N-acetyltransferase [Mycobacterium sp.]|nr:GNAT family N-acetyltransferase [Mycobacterium sp.]